MPVPARTNPTPRARGGLTFVEVLLASALLTGLAAIVFGAVNLWSAAAEREVRRAEAMEVAHRVILQYIDDFKWIRGQEPVVMLNGRFYHFELLTEDLAEESIDDNRTRRRAVERGSLTASERMQSQLVQLTVTVYAEDADGFVDPTPDAMLRRIYNPVLGAGGMRGFQYTLDVIAGG